MKSSRARMLLSATAFLALSGIAAAGETGPQTKPRCRVGNGKNVTYVDDVFAWTRARAAGKEVTVKVKAEPIAAAARAPAKGAR